MALSARCAIRQAPRASLRSSANLSEEQIEARQLVRGQRVEKSLLRVEKRLLIFRGQSGDETAEIKIKVRCAPEVGAVEVGGGLEVGALKVGALKVGAP